MSDNVKPSREFLLEMAAQEDELCGGNVTAGSMDDYSHERDREGCGMCPDCIMLSMSAAHDVAMGVMQSELARLESDNAALRGELIAAHHNACTAENCKLAGDRWHDEAFATLPPEPLGQGESK